MHDVILFLVGIVSGGMNAIAGGGMLLGFPVLVAAGLPALVANASTGVIVLPGQLASAIGYRRYLRKIPKNYLLLIPSMIIGSAIGANLLRHTSQAHFDQLIPGLILLAVILFAFQPLLHHHLHRHLHGRAKSHAPLIVMAIALLPMTIYGGYFGAGFGFIMLAFLGFTTLHDAHQINALKNIAAVVIAGTVTICLYSSHLIDWRHGLVMAAGNTLGGYAGAVVAQKVSTHLVRLAVILIGLASVIFLAIQYR